MVVTRSTYLGVFVDGEAGGEEKREGDEEALMLFVVVSLGFYTSVCGQGSSGLDLRSRCAT